MRKYFNFLQKISKLDFFLICALILLAFYPWHQLPLLTIRPDGFLYLTSSEQNLIHGSSLWVGIEGTAILWGIVLTKLFGVNMSLYFGFELIAMLIIDVFFYFMVKAITKKSWIAFISALMFSVNYIGLWDMHSAHCYCWFMERPIDMLLLMPSFALLHLFLEKGAKKYYLISLFLYFIGVGGAHFLFLFTGPFLLYPIFWHVFSKRKFIEKIKGLRISLSYLALTILFLLGQDTIQKGVGGNKGLMDFLLHPEKSQYFYKILMSFVNWTQLPALIISMHNNPYANPLSVAQHAGNLIWFTPYIVVAYVLAFIIIYFKLPKLRALILTCLVGSFTISFLSIYATTHFDPSQFGPSRYLYLQTYLLTIFWTLFLWSLYLINGKFIPIIIGTVIVYYSVNVMLIQKSFNVSIVENISTRAIFSKLEDLMPKLRDNTLIIGTYPEISGTEADFFTEQLGKGKIRVMSDFNRINPIPWQEEASKSSHLIKLKYDQNTKRVIEEKIK